MNSFLVLPTNISPDRLLLTGDEAHHCGRVLRMHEGEVIMAIDGIGSAYRARIELVAPKEIVCTILETIPEMNEPARKVVLGLSLLKHSAKFDIVVEKAVELGVSAIIPIVAEHSERHRGKTERWKDIATSAAKQSLRCRIPEIDEPKNLEDACVREPFGAIAIAHELAPTEQSFGHFLEKRLGEHGSLLVLIGPEGGFTEQECKTAESLGAERVSLGTRRLRSETAAILAVGLATAILESRE